MCSVYTPAPSKITCGLNVCSCELSAKLEYIYMLCVYMLCRWCVVGVSQPKIESIFVCVCVLVLCVISIEVCAYYIYTRYAHRGWFVGGCGLYEGLFVCAHAGCDV